jgi:hypothetical protein
VGRGGIRGIEGEVRKGVIIGGWVDKHEEMVLMVMKDTRIDRM